MSIRSLVLDYLSRASRSPRIASDQAEIESMRRLVLEDPTGGFGALVAPIAPMTWEQRVLLLGANAQSERIAFRMPYAMEIVGMMGILESTGAPGGAIVPTLNSVDVQIDINNQNFATSLEGVSTSVPGATRGGSFVSLAAVSIQAPRLTSLLLTSPAPEVGATFRWKRGAGVYQDTLISLALFVRRLGDNESANVAVTAKGL